VKEIIKQITPPVIVDGARWARARVNAAKKRQGLNGPSRPFDPEAKTQELGVYWTDDMAAQLESWGRGTTWDEIAVLFAGRTGTALDIACGTGVNMLDLDQNTGLEVWGIDISDLLLGRAEKKGIMKDRLILGDATKLPFQDGQFDYCYSIGSLEHFTEEGLEAAIAESARVTKVAGFHMMPVSESDADEGWMQRNQSFWNNSVQWWVAKFQKSFPRVMTMRSGWADKGCSIGMWFVVTEKR
jgi:ubiquinone/menaquinone biosynthesis C-methylase UbiE